MAQQEGNNTDTTTNSTRLRIAVPVKEGFTEFVNVRRDQTTGELTASGFALDIFKAVVNSAMPYTVSFDFVPFARPNGSMNGSYDDMLQAVFSGDYDAAVGDITIRYYRTEWVDYSIAYSDTGVSMLVPLRLKAGDKPTSFFARLPDGLIGAAVGVCFITALVFWICHHKNTQKNAAAPGEITAGRTRLVIVLCFLMLVVVTTCLGSILISLQIAPKKIPLLDHHINDFIRDGKNIGYQTGSFVRNMLTQRGFSDSQLKSFSNVEQLLDLFSKGSSGGGIDAAIDETPYLKLFLTRHCNAYTLVPSANLHADGFGFAFRKEAHTDLVRDISIATLKVTNNDVQLRDIKERTIGDLDSCREDLNPEFDLIDWKPSMWILVAGIIGIVALMLIFCPVYFASLKVSNN
ncbi:Glutamate receptor 2.5 [Bienertia sinuspersici]